MKRRVGLVRTIVIGALLGSTALVLPSAQATAAEPVPFWWFHGSLEVGGRFFLNNPEKDGQASSNQKSLAKYYEYSKVAPGPFGNAWLSTGSKDGLYQVDFVGRNIGYSDQNYYLDLSQAGKHYLSLGWDEIPHVYSKSAQTPYAVNGNRLTLLPGITTPITTSALLPLSPKTDIGIARDTASVEYRWTPTDAWDIKTDYSHMRRTGTQVASIYGLSIGPLQLPRPVADTTQNYGANGEYAGTSPWGQRVTAKVGYFGSQYTDDYSAYFVQNPSTAAVGAPPFAQVSTPPSNQANGFNGSIAADLPWKSRYVGTMSYNMMRQDAAFIPMSSQTIVGAPQPTVPASSLDGKIDTLLLNNVLTSKITPELTNKLSYRYYNFHNGTPELYIQNWVALDSATANTSLRHFTRSLSISYTKQNAGEALVWKPSRAWTLGAAYGYERYSWDRTDVDATNEHSGKVFVDWKPASWLTVRSSGYYGNRRYENYSSVELGHYQWPGDPFPAGTQSVRYRESYRQFMFSNRETWKANFATDIVVARGLTVTPTFKYQDEQYGVNPVDQQGLKDRRVLSAGLEGTAIVNPTTSITAGYVRDFVTQLMFGNTCVNDGSCTAAHFQTQTNNRMAIDTAFILLRHAAIPDKLDTELRYTASRGVDSINLFLGNGGALTGGQFPDMTTWYQRLDASATYKFDKEQVARLGWKGDVKAKLRYTWERNSVSWYASDWFTPTLFASQLAGNGPFIMGSDNPNYNVHMLGASLIFGW